MKNYLIPHPNVANVEFGSAHLKKVTTLFNENFASLDGHVQAVQTSLASLDAAKSAADHDHDTRYARLEHTHTLQELAEVAAMFDTKADLDHTHSQYLTELPSHQHAVNEVDGLIELLNGKAPSAHSHSFGEIDGLDELAASAATIDLLNQRADEVLAAAGNYTDGQIEAKVPKPSTDVPEADSASGAVGTSGKFADGSHQHKLNFPDDRKASSLKIDGAGSNGAAQFGTTNKYADLGHSHPLNYPKVRKATVLSPDGFGEGGTPLFGNINYYADLGHSHPLNVSDVSPADVSSSASVGCAHTYARSDHVHKISDAVLEDIKSSLSGVKSVDGKNPDANGNVDLKALTETDYPGLASIEGNIDPSHGQIEIITGTYVGGATSERVRLLGVAANGYAVSTAEQIGADMVSLDGTNTLAPETAPTEKKVLTLASGTTTPVWNSASGSAEDPGQNVTDLAAAVPGASTINKATYGGGSGKGVQLRFVTRVLWTGTEIREFYRTAVFDKGGRLFSVSAEALATVDTPTVVTWS